MYIRISYNSRGSWRKLRICSSQITRTAQRHYCLDTRPTRLAMDIRASECLSAFNLCDLRARERKVGRPRQAGKWCKHHSKHTKLSYDARWSVSLSRHRPHRHREWDGPACDVGVTLQRHPGVTAWSKEERRGAGRLCDYDQPDLQMSEIKGDSSLTRVIVHIVYRRLCRFVDAVCRMVSFGA